MLELAERLAAERFAPANRVCDSQEPYVENGRVVLPKQTGEALGALAEAGLLGAVLEESVGGMQLPLTISTAAYAWLYAANVGAAGYALLTTAAANMLASSATREQVTLWVPPMIEGRFFGTMCLSEPQAGSSLAAEWGVWLLRGLVECGHCHLGCNCHRMRGRNGTWHRYYYCRGHDVLRARSPEGRCPERNIRADDLDRYV